MSRGIQELFRPHMKKEKKVGGGGEHSGI